MTKKGKKEEEESDEVEDWLNADFDELVEKAKGVDDLPLVDSKEDEDKDEILNK